MSASDEKAVWSTAFINNLPDAAFALVKPGGKKDSDGKTVPRSLRMLPHHNASVKSATENSSVDLPHLRAALTRAAQPGTDLTPEQRSRVKGHLAAHAKALGVGGKADPEGICRKDFDLEIRSINEESRSLRMIASTPARDSYGDVLRPFWNLSHFNKNPVVLFAHNRGARSPAELIPVGFSKDHEVNGEQLEFEPTFTDDQANPNAERVWQGIKQKVLRAASVGFRPGKIVREEDDKGVVTYFVGTKDQPNILKEISIVPIGANHEAVALDADGASDIAKIYEERELSLVADETEDSTAAGGGSTPTEERKMDLNELKTAHPAVYEEALKLGAENAVTAERKRVSAHLNVGQKCGAMDIAMKAIKDGVDFMDPEVQSEYLTAGRNKADVETRQAETDAAGKAADGAKAVETTKDLQDIVADNIAAGLGL